MPISEQQSQMPVVQVPEETCWVVTIVVDCAMTAKKEQKGIERERGITRRG